MKTYLIGICCTFAGSEEEYEIQAHNREEAEKLAYAEAIAAFQPEGWVIEEITFR